MNCLYCNNCLASSPQAKALRCYKTTALNLLFLQKSWIQFSSSPFLVSMKQVRSRFLWWAKQVYWCVCLSVYQFIHYRTKSSSPAHRGIVAGRGPQMIPYPSSCALQTASDRILCFPALKLSWESCFWEMISFIISEHHSSPSILGGW